MQEIIDQIRAELNQMADAHVRESGQRFFKESVNMYGTKTKEVVQMSKKYLKEVKKLPKEQVWSMCETLWKSGMMEESFIACNWSEAFSKQFTPTDFRVLEHWVQTYVSNWASCDTLCNHTVANFVMMYPETISELKRWAHSENRWVQRASAVTLIIPARKGMFLADIFEIAELLLHSSDDLVQKGYGWMLKAASEAHCEAVFQFVLKHKATMPRTALRYAIEKMDPEKRKLAMAK
jgi:3-methyladenine DNA glycosylase AlkD